LRVALARSDWRGEFTPQHKPSELLWCWWMFTDLPSSRGSGYYGYVYQPPPSPQSKCRMGPFSQVHSRHKQVIFGVAAAVLFIICIFYLRPTLFMGPGTGSNAHSRGLSPLEACLRYPHQQAFHKYDQSSSEYDIVVVADMDKASKMEGGQWKSMLKYGKLMRNPGTGKYTVSWNKDVDITSPYNDGSRGMELSDLTYFNEQLLTFDDRTGIAYFIEQGKVIPKHILMDGNGHNEKGLKVEWATVKDSHLYVGSTGKEWTTTKGEFVNNNPQWIARVDVEGRIERVDWGQHYTALRKATNTLFPGYLLHEAVRWNPALRRWFFLPRRVSHEPYDEALDEERGSNTVISTNEEFSDIRISHIGENKPTHGFSAFQFLPFREHEVVALKSEEHHDDIHTYLMVFDLAGQVLLEETLVGNVKFEGLEVI